MFLSESRDGRRSRLARIWARTRSWSGVNGPIGSAGTSTLNSPLRRVMCWPLPRLAWGRTDSHSTGPGDPPPDTPLAAAGAGAGAARGSLAGAGAGAAAGAGWRSGWWDTGGGGPESPHPDGLI